MFKRSAVVVSDFHLIDLVSQAAAVQRLLRGKSPAEKLEWLAMRGKISHLPVVVPGWPDRYFFESSIGMQCAFAFMEDDFFHFCGDHHFFVVRDDG